MGKPPLGSFIKFHKQGKGFCLGSVPYDLLSRKLQAGKKLSAEGNNVSRATRLPDHQLSPLNTASFSSRSSSSLNFGSQRNS